MLFQPGGNRMIRRVMLAVAMLAGISGTIVASAGLLSAPAAACSGDHTS
jgi:hypothetical protein